ncbi:retrovirus-related Pol polyprotein from transposon 17.6 [Trichonephila inaurata madagascariensis]|uniref:Retrovirus-related Pol polyprotein from transposon 17.6 n=1 Tax=Trichonephila inaurata madagascariensis TaxID=2747483 RepID=A0A8X6WX64_9ARAC|nr:retrovirus-related Pol polyprotein from transposon 17.6 [Trichonephila inaurata madagascariensis]
MVLNASKSVLGKTSKISGALGDCRRRFIPHAARTQAVLNNYLKGAKRNDQTPILWFEESAAAFEKCKKDLVEATVLYHLSADTSLAIVVDASDTPVDAALHQLTSRGWQPLAFFSKTLQHSGGTVHMIESCWQLTWPLNTSGTWWKDRVSLFLLSTSLWYVHLSRRKTNALCDSSDTWI